MDMGIVVLVIVILAVIGGAVLLFKGAFWLVDEFHKPNPFGIEKPPPRRARPSAVRPPAPKAQKVPEVDPNWPQQAYAAPPPKPKLGEATQRKPRKKVEMPKGNVKGIPPGAKKLDI